MTFYELTEEVNNKFGDSIERPWPKTYEVDYETYINVVHKIFEYKTIVKNNGIKWVTVAIGPNYRIMFKNMELIPMKEIK